MRLAQITDLHARRHLPGSSDSARRRSREAFDRLPRTLADLAKLEIDLLALTGDLLDVPDGVESEPAWQAAAEADYGLLRAMLEAAGLTWLELPGNHDWQPAMRRVFGDRPRTLSLGGYRVVSFWDCEGPGHVPFRPPAERQRFDRALARPQPQVHLQHYLIAPDLPDAGWPYNYAEAAELRAAMAAGGQVSLCLAGHYHDGTDLLRDGPTTFAVGPAYAHAPHPARIYCDSGGGVWSVTALDLAGSGKLAG
jgi:hypothetical protein